MACSRKRSVIIALTSLLANPGGLSFAMLRQHCGLTDGNLSRHLEVLEAAKLVEITRTVDDARPQSLVRITAGGRRRFLGYLSVLEQVLLDAGATAEGEDGRVKGLLQAQGR